MSMLLGCDQGGEQPIALEPGDYSVVATCNGRTYEESASVELLSDGDPSFDGDACNGSGQAAGEPNPRLAISCISAIGLANFTVHCFEVDQVIVCTGSCRESDPGEDLVEAEDGGVVVLRRLPVL
ncbi:MAG: hypothetical protein R3B40_04100 [Polyangiales bacterium]